MGSRGYLRSYIRGEVIFRQGEPGHVMYFLQSGRVRITQGVRGQEQTLATLGKGSFFGELALFTHRKRSATAEAVEDCSLIEVESEQLDQFLEEYPTVARQMVNVLAKRLRETDDMLENMRLDDSESRVTNALLQSVEEHGGHDRVDILFDLELLCQRTSLSSEKVRTVLRKLEKHHLIQYVDGYIHVPSTDMLRGYQSMLSGRVKSPPEGA